MVGRTCGATLGKLKQAARAFFATRPKKQDLLPGLSEEDFGPEVVDVLPDCELALRAFDLLGTQWRVGAAGATGIDYAAIRPTLRMSGIAVSSWPDLLDDLRAMEAEALAFIHRDR